MPLRLRLFWVLTPEWVVRLLFLKRCPECRKKPKIKLNEYGHFITCKDFQLEANDIGLPNKVVYMQWNQFIKSIGKDFKKKEMESFNKNVNERVKYKLIRHDK